MLDADAVGETFATWLTSISRISVDDRLARVTRDHIARLSPLPLVLAQNEMAELLGVVKLTASARPSVVQSHEEQEVEVTLQNDSPLALQKLSVEITERGLPHNIAAEQTILGALLLEGSLSAGISACLPPDDFSADANKRIYSAMLLVANSGRPVDMITLVEQLHSTGQVEAVGGVAYLSSLIDKVPPKVEIQHLARIIHENAEFRQRFRGTRANTSTNIVAPGNQLSVPVHIAAGPPRQITLEVIWSAQRLNAEPATGSIEIGIDVRAAAEPLKEIDLGRSPYVVGTPIDRPSMFYGRADLLDQVRRALRSDGPASVILLEGNRRTGKTSILKHLTKVSDLAGWVRVYCSFQSTEGRKGVAGVPTGEVFYSIARELILAVHEAGYSFDVPGLGVLDSNLSKASLRHSLLTNLHPLFEGPAPFEQLQIIVESAIGAVQPNRVLLMLDEFDKLQEGIDHGITSPQLPENIRYLFHTYSELSGILTGSRRIKRLRDEYWSALFGIGCVISVTALDEYAARSLVTKPVEGRLVFAPAAVDRVLFLTAR
jgi:hypothetical protein